MRTAQKKMQILIIEADLSEGSNSGYIKNLQESFNVHLLTIDQSVGTAENMVQRINETLDEVRCDGVCILDSFFPVETPIPRNPFSPVGALGQTLNALEKYDIPTLVVPVSSNRMLEKLVKTVYAKADLMDKMFLREDQVAEAMGKTIRDHSKKGRSR